MTGSWKNASGILKSPGNFFNQDSGNPSIS